MNSKKTIDPFQFFDDQSEKPSAEEVKEQRKQLQKLSAENKIGLTAKIKKDLEEKKKHRNKIKKICNSGGIGLTAQIRMGIEQQLEEPEDENMADKYGYGYEESDEKNQNTWDSISPTAHIKRTLSDKWQNSDGLGLTEKIARSVLTSTSATGQVEVKTGVFWDLFIFFGGIALTVTLAFGIIYAIEKIL